MTTYGDAAPEDGYDAGDPLAVRLELLARIVDEVGDHDTGRRAEVRRVLGAVRGELVDALTVVNLLRERLER